MTEPPSSTPLSFVTRKTTFLTAVLKYLLWGTVLIVSFASAVFLLIYPLWYLATQQKEIYTGLIFTGLIGLLTTVFLFRLRRAVKNSRFDEFSAGLLRRAALLFFLACQVLMVVVHVGLLGVGGGQNPFTPPVLTLDAVGIGFASCSLLFLARARRGGLLSRVGFTICVLFFSLQSAYWAAVFYVNSNYPYALALFLIVLGFFFFKKITKIKIEKKNPSDEKDFR